RSIVSVSSAPGKHSATAWVLSRNFQTSSILAGTPTEWLSFMLTYLHSNDLNRRAIPLRGEEFFREGWGVLLDGPRSRLQLRSRWSPPVGRSVVRRSRERSMDRALPRSRPRRR